MKKKNKLFLMGSILILLGLALFIYNYWENYQIAKRTDLLNRKLQEKFIKNMQVSVADKRPDYIKNPEMEMPIVFVNGQEYIGYIFIPSLKLKLPVLDSWSYPKLKLAPARFKGSVYLNDMIILAHNYKAHFGNLHLLEIGDKIIFKDMDSNIFNYKVEKIEELDPIQIDEMVSGDWDLTLFTCTIGGSTRVTIRANKVYE